MKKNICVIIIICILATLSISFADDAATIRENKEQYKQFRIQLEERMREYRDRINEVKSMYNEIRKNTAQLAKLKKEAIEAQRRAKKHIQKLIKDKDAITDKQFIKLKEAVVTLNEARNVFRVTIGEIDRVSLKLRAATRNRNISQIRQHGQKIVDEQKLRINELEKLINDLNNISQI